MADICKCGNGALCEFKDNCYRWTAIASEYWQSYCDFYDPKEPNCKHLWKNKID